MPDDDDRRFETLEVKRADWNAEDATEEVWSRGDSDTADMIAVSLRENQIPYRTTSEQEEGASVSEETGVKRLFVRPENSARAKEIAREIVDATPPE